MPVPPVIQMYRYVMGSGGGLGNLLKASEEFQQTVDWVRYPTSSQTPTVNADSRPDPNGGTTADQVGLTANTSARLQQTVTLSASTEYTFSVHARAVSGSVDFRMRNVTLKDAEVKTATTTGPLTNGFTRFTYRFTTGAAGPYELALQNDTNATAKDVIFWGAMLNQGGTALDYEYAAPTTGGSAPAPAYAGFGDAFGGVTAYYSLRQFTEAETLNAIRVRRSSDDTEQDIGFDANGDLDTTALTAFVNEDVNLFTSDYSSGGVAEPTRSNFTVTINETKEGKTECLKAVWDGTSPSQLFKFNFLPIEQGVTFDISAEFYIEGFTGLRMGANGNVGDLNSTTNNWETYSQTITVNNTNDDFVISLSGGTSGSTIWLKNIVITQTTADGAVTTWYDQSGNGNDATNSTESEQPLVVSGGTLVEENSKAAIDFDGANDTLLSSTSFAQPYTAFAVRKFDSAADQMLISHDTSTFYGVEFRFVATTRLSNGTYLNHSVSPTTTQGLLYALGNGSNSQISIDGGTTTTGNSGSAGASELSIGGRASYYLNGKIQEVIYLDSDQSANRGTVTTGGGTGIKGNINTYFDIV